MFRLFSLLSYLRTTGTRRPGRTKRQRRTALWVEALEARALPTVAFTPIYGAEQSHFTHNTGAATTLKDPPIYLIFWGSYWTANPAAVTSLTDDLTNVLANSVGPYAGAYLSGTTQYQTSGAATIVADANPAYAQVAGFGGITAYVDASNEPPPTVSSKPVIGDPVSDEVEQLINNSNGVIPDPGQLHGITPIDVVITPPTVGGVGGQDSFNEPSDPGTGRYHEVIWLDTQALAADPSGLSQDVTESHFTHELVETMTDPSGIVGGYHVDAGSKWTRGGDHQLCDFEAGNYFYRVGNGAVAGGVICEAYWSQTGPDPGTFIVPDGNTLTMTVLPVPWVNGSFAGGRLVINAKQTGIPGSYVGKQQITLDAVTMPGDNLLGASSLLGVQVVMDGQKFAFEPGEITSVEVDTANDGETIAVNNTVPGVPVTVNLGSGQHYQVNLSGSQGTDPLQSAVIVANSHGGSAVVRVDPLLGGVPIQGTVSVNNPGGGRLDVQVAPSGALNAINATIAVVGGGALTTVEVNDQPDAANTAYHVQYRKLLGTTSQLSIDAEPSFLLGYTGVATLALTGGSGNDTFELSHWRPGAGEGRLNLTAGSFAQLGGSSGTTTIGGPAYAVHWVLDTPYSGHATFVGSSATLNAAWPGTGSITIGGGVGTADVPVAGNTFAVLATGEPTILYTGQGKDAVYVGQPTANVDGSPAPLGTLAALLMPLTIHGQGKTNQLFVNDALAATAESYTVTPATVTRTGAATIRYDQVNTVTLTVGKANGDSVDATPSPTTADVLIGNAKAYQAGHADQLTVELANATLPKLKATSAASGLWTFGNRQGLTYSNFQLPAPTVTALSPASGPTTGGTTVTITGTDFTGTTSVAFGAAPALSFTIDSATQITAVAPAHAVGPVDVTVRWLALKTSAASSADRYTYLPPLQLSWPSPSPITYGTALSATQLDATANLAGTFSYSPAAGTVPAAGTQTLTATFGPTGATATVQLTVNRATPTVTASDAGGTANGQPFPASATVTGIPADGTIDTAPDSLLTFTYYVGTGTGGTNLGGSAPASAGTYTVVAHYAGSANYTSADSSPVTFSIGVASPATPTVQVSVSSGSYTGQPLAVTATVAGSNGIPANTLEGVGLTLQYYQLFANGSSDSLVAAPTDAGNYQVVASFAGSADYTSASSAPANFTISPATPQVTVNPVTIDLGTMLVNGQLSGTATATVNGAATNVPGTFSYTSQAGATLDAGSQTEAVTFSPASPDFAVVATSVQVTVNQETPTITLTSSVNPAGYITYVTFTATLQAAVDVPQGTVTFYDGTQALAVVTLHNFGTQATFTTRLAVGTHAITAVYTDTVDNNFVGVTSAVLQETWQGG